MWKGHECGPDNFTQVFTDLGVCYTFNGDKDNPLYTQSPGEKLKTLFRTA